MTWAQACALPKTTRQDVESLPCEHQHLKLEESDDGYLTGDYHCLACGNAMPR